jgi:hypothetical protein
MKLSTSDEAKEIDALQDFAQKNANTTQSAFAELHAADLAAKDGKLDQAIHLYDEVAQNMNIDPAFRQLADLLSIRLQLDTAVPADLEKRLQLLMADDMPWHFTAREYAGYAALRAGNKDKAKQIFTDLSQNVSAPQSVGARAADMLRYVSE